MLQRRGRPGCEGAGVVMTRQYVHNACIRCPSLLLPPLMRLRGFPSACRTLAEELVPSSRMRETALARASSIPSVVR